MANHQLQAKLVICNIPTKNSVAARKFYNTLFGGEDFARSLNDETESYFRPISQDGLVLTIASRWDDREPVTCFFAVDNLDETVKHLESVGGKVVVKPTSMPTSGSANAVNAFHDARSAQGLEHSTSLGNFVTMLDPDGNYIGLTQLDQSMQAHFNAQPAQRTLTKSQVDSIEQWKKQSETAA